MERICTLMVAGVDCARVAQRGAASAPPAACDGSHRVRARVLELQNLMKTVTELPFFALNLQVAELAEIV